jgi:hypothetical protein
MLLSVVVVFFGSLVGQEAIWTCECGLLRCRFSNMPADNRRLQGPESTFPYALYISKKRTYNDVIDELITSDEKRKDGRKLNDQRRICKNFEPRLNFVY